MVSKNLPVAVHIFPTLDYVEIVKFNEKSGDIETAGSLPCAFDPVSRQLSDSGLFEQTLRDLFEVNRIPFATPTVLVLPGFFTREIDLPAEFTRDELRFALVSEAERFYIFKKIEPQVDWIKLDKDRLLYSAFPKPEIDKYITCFQNLRIPLLAIDLNYLSMLRGMLATGLIGGEVLSGKERWSLLAINDNAMFVAMLEGMQILRTTDVPLSVAQGDESTCIAEIQQDYHSFVAEDEFSRLVLVNNSYFIDSQQLLLHLGHMGELTLIVQNADTLGSRGNTHPMYPCSLEGIGGVFHQRFPELPGLNFLPASNLGLASIVEYQSRAIRILLLANGALFILCLVIWGILNLVAWQKQGVATELASKTGQITTGDNPQQKQMTERKQLVKAVLDRNVKINNVLVKAGSVMPATVWLDRLQAESTELAKPMSLKMEGKTTQLDSVNELVKALNTAVPSADLHVGTAAQASSTDGQTYFTWTIENKPLATTTEAGSPAPAPPPVQMGSGPR